MKTDMNSKDFVDNIINNIPKLPVDYYNSVITSTVIGILDDQSASDSYYQYICDVYIEDEINEFLDKERIALDAEQYENYYKYCQDIRKEFVKLYEKR